MMHKRTLVVVSLSIASALALGACNKSPAPQHEAETTAPATGATAAPTPAVESAPATVSVTAVDLGSAVGADQKVTAPTTTFSPGNTIYAAVATTGKGTATLDAKWIYQDGQTIKEDSKSIAADGPATTTFSISKPDGWPTGNYKIEVTLNGTPAMSKDFTVK